MLLVTTELVIWRYANTFIFTNQSEIDFGIGLIYFAFIKYLSRKWEYNEAVHQLFIDFKKVYDSVRREVLL